jgi:cyclic pyranopterin phosphate synthase
MKVNELTHIDSSGNPRMVNVSEKDVTLRTARAQAVVHLGKEVMNHVVENDIRTRKGSVVQTAIIAGTMAAKKTADLIPLAHPNGLDSCTIEMAFQNDALVIVASASVRANTGVEMEALTAATVAALTVYDMCKSLSHHLVISDIRLLEKTGGKKDFKFT